MATDDLDPFRALEPDDPRWVDPPTDAAARLRRRLRKNMGPLLVVGHRGAGKSSAVHRVADGWPEERPLIRVHVDQLPSAPRADRFAHDLAGALVAWWIETGVTDQPSTWLIQDLRASDPVFPQGTGRSLKPFECARDVAIELSGAFADARPTVLIDGLDAIEPTETRAILAELLKLTPHLELAVVATPSLAYGADNLDLLERWRITPIATVDPEHAEHRAWLVEVAIRHLGVARDTLDDEAAAVLDAIAAASGGVLRELLALARDAWAYGDDALTSSGLEQALADRRDRLRRLVQAGDRALLAQVRGTGGLELPMATKTRLLEHGLLLELGDPRDPMVRPHPLVEPWLTDVGRGSSTGP